MVYGVWFMVYGLWFMVYGLWCMVYGLWFMGYGLGGGARNLMHAVVPPAHRGEAAMQLHRLLPCALGVGL